MIGHGYYQTPSVQWCIAIWIGNAHEGKGLYFQCLHCGGIVGGNLVIVAGKVEQAVDDQVGGVMFKLTPFSAASRAQVS